MRTTQLVFAAALIVCLAMALATPETVDRQPAAETRPSRFGLRPGGRAGFASGAALGVFSFAVLGLVTAMGAVILHTELGVSSPFMAGSAPFLMFGWSAAGLLILWRLSLARMLVTGAVVFPLGLALVALSLLHPSLWLYLVAVSIAGIGAGALFKGGVGTASSVALPDSRAGVLAMFFVSCYAGMGVPPILFSIVLGHLTIEAAVIVFSAALSVGFCPGSRRGAPQGRRRLDAEVTPARPVTR